jgi:type II secretory pathway component PulF
MANYICKAINEKGKIVSDVIEAESEEMVNSILASRNLIPSKIVIEDSRGGNFLSRIQMRLRGTVRESDLIIFTKQFRSMLNAGVPILRILKVLEAQTENKVLKQAITTLIQDIKQGSSLFEAMEKHPYIFSKLYRSMIRAGELSGSVPSVLDRLIYIIEHETKVRSDIKSALTYPKVVVIALSLAFLVLLTFVVPQFVSLFSKAGLILPLPTKVAMHMHAFLKNYWYIVLIAIIASVYGYKMYVKTKQGEFVRDAFLLRIPVLGPLFKKAAMSRFASIFAILQSSGVPVLQSLEILSETIGNTAISRAFDHVRDRVEEGAGISAPLKSAQYFTPMVIDMIAIGEESGNIDEMLREITKHYDDEVEYAVKGLTDIIGPILIVGLAAVVGFFALAIFMPMWDLTKMAK